MRSKSRPSLDTLVPLVMIDSVTNDGHADVLLEPPKGQLMTRKDSF